MSLIAAFLYWMYFGLVFVEFAVLLLVYEQTLTSRLEKLVVNAVGFPFCVVGFLSTYYTGLLFLQMTKLKHVGPLPVP